jgi:GDSL-like lipase/acylhydrolase family protein
MGRRKFLLSSGAWGFAGAAHVAAARPAAKGESSMTHVVLAGDSVFDNGAYVAGGPDVVRQLRPLLPDGFRATLRARDGATISGIASQVAQLPADASHLVISIGGNDALGEVGALEQATRSVADALDVLAAVRDRFQRDYRAMLDRVQELRLDTAICTIYEARFPDPMLRRAAATALTALNDGITREAFARNLTLIDLRLICDNDEDFANPIEPSLRGGDKIARAILRFATNTPRPQVIARS